MGQRKLKVKTINCRKAKQFIELLSPHGKVFGEEEFPRSWVFRGHADCRFQLTPSALRRDHPLKDFPFLAANVRPTTNSEQIADEIGVFSEFFRQADSTGLALPEDSQAVRRILERLPQEYRIESFGPNRTKDFERAPWPPDELLSSLGLAQHYGLPTRLLDWTRHASVAAYFAADGAARARDRRRKDARLGVWALDEDLEYKVLKKHEQSIGKKPLMFVTAPAASNPNLYAQSGLFTLYRPRVVNIRGRIDRTPLNELLRERCVALERPPHDIMMYHFTLPKRQAGSLLSLLSMEGKNGATIFPGYQGVVKSLKEPTWWFAS